MLFYARHNRPATANAEYAFKINHKRCVKKNPENELKDSGKIHRSATKALRFLHGCTIDFTNLVHPSLSGVS